MATSFQNKKQLKFVITLGTGSFGTTKNNQITLQGFRASVDIDKAGGQMMGELRAQIYGVSQSDMNSITTLQWKPGYAIKNTIQVFAVDGNQVTLVFQGNILNAWGNYDSMPDVYLQIQAQSAFFNQLIAVAPRSFKGSIGVATIMQQIANSMGLTFENNGVSTQLTDVYLPNTDLTQARLLARAAGIVLIIDDTTLAICPPNTSRKGIVPLISDQTGLSGYPTFDGVGVNFSILFNPAVTFGGSIKLTSSIKQASGTWIVTSIAHKLESEKDGGAWFSKIRGNSSGLAISK